jgi:PKD repeat protein
MRLASLALATALVLGAMAAMGAPSASATPTCADPSIDETPPPHEGQPLSGEAGTCVPPEPITTITLSWYRCDDAGMNCDSLVGTGDTYTPVLADVGNKLQLRQSADDGIGLPEDRSVVTANPVNGNPTASFDFTPPVLRANQVATFDATSSTDPENDSLTYTWDFDNDGSFDDGSGSTAPWTFTSPGTHTVRLQADDHAGGTNSAIQVVTVKGPPVADFTISPQTALTGQTVQLKSTSSDPDNDPISYAWDLDGDGDFSDGASGATATVSFTSPGSHVVALRVTADGETSTKFASIVVKTPPATTPASVSPRLLSPFPVVIISGRLTGTGARLSQLTIRAPKGSTVRVICHGRRCPYRRARHVSRTGKVRFRGLQKRLPAGTVIEVFVTKPGTIGKYTRFRIRAGKPPRRLDRCLLPNSSKPSRCPSQ